MAYKVNTFPDREISIDGKTFLYFGGTSYLGLQTDSEFQDLYIKNIRQYGTNYGASRMGNVRLSVYGKAEAFLADLIGTEKCLTVSSGYLAGQLILNHFVKTGFTTFYAPGTHEAVHSAQSINHDTFDSLIDNVRKETGKGNDKMVLFLDSIDLKGKNYPHFSWLKELPAHRLIVVVDDSHGLGVVGDDGAGVYRTLNSFNFKELIVCSSLGKGFGIQAGLCAGRDQRIKDLRSSNMFAASSPAAAAALGTLIEAKKIIREKRKVLKRSIALFIKSLQSPQVFEFIPNYPSFLVKDAELTSYLDTNGIIITDFRYPSEKDEAVRRIVISAYHTQDDIRTLANVINGYYSKGNASK